MIKTGYHTSEFIVHPIVKLIQKKQKLLRRNDFFIGKKFNL